VWNFMPPSDPKPRTHREGADYLATLRPDCRHFNGYKPCGFQYVCEGCEHFQPRGARVAIIKLGAMGDVLRSTPLLAGLRRRHPEGISATWITQRESLALLRHHPDIRELIAIEDSAALLGLECQLFDALYCLDKEPPALGLSARLEAQAKFGFQRGAFGGLGVWNDASWRALKLGLDDPLKFRLNQRTHLEILFEMAELPFRGEEIELALGPESLRARDAWSARWEGKRPVIGVNPGSGWRFPSKRWPDEQVLECAAALREIIPGATVALLGGPEERDRNARLLERAPDLLTGTSSELSLEEFFGLVASLDALVSTDSLAMHLGVALKKPVVALFGPTSAVEIDLFGRGAKAASDFACSPCYLAQCPQPVFCMTRLDGKRVATEAAALLARKPLGALPEEIDEIDNINKI
jgi:ADP-heptose:LPS heptosyltransferase